MSIDEMIEAAKNGDANASLAIANTIINSGNPNVDQALFWLDMASGNGSVEASLVAGKIRKEKMKQAKANAQWSTVREQFGLILQLNKQIVDNDNVSLDAIENSKEIFEQSCYLFAFALYMNDDFAEAVDFLTKIESVPTPLMHILMGCSLFGLCVKNKELTTNILEDIRVILSVLEMNPQRFINAAEDNLDYLLLAKAFGYLSIILRSAPNNDVQRAYNVLKKGSDLLPASHQSILQVELGRYKQRLFGGMQYV